ncbi:MAG: hypothetical protein ACERLM_12125, partial [Acidimicrobiales bacterium]
MTRMLRWSLLVVAVLAMFLTGCGDDDASDEPAVTGTTAPVDSTSTTTGPEATTTTEAASTTTEPGTAAPAREGSNVYWAWTVDTTSAATPEQLGAGGRPEIWRNGVFAPNDALDALLADEVDAAALDSIVLWRARRDRPDAAALRTVATLGPFPVQPVVVRS